MNYLIIAQLIIRPFICEQVNASLGFFFDITFLGCFLLFILNSKQLKVKKSVFLISLIFPFFIVLSNFFSVNSYNSQAELLRIFVLVLIFNFVCLLESKQRRFLIAGMLCISGIICLRALYQYFSGIDFIRDSNSFEQLTKDGFYAWELLLNKRAVSWFVSPNILGGYLIGFFPLASVYLFKSIGEKNTTKILIFSFLCLFLFLSLLLTKALAVFLSFILSMIFLFVLIYKDKDRGVIKRYAGIALLFSCVCLFGLFFSRREAFIDLKNPQNSITQRLYYWQSSLKIINEHPLVGVGAGNFKIVYPRFKNASANETIYAHNSYLQIWAESGLPALAFFIVFVFIVFRVALKKRISPVDSGMIAGCLGVLLYNFLDYSFFITQATHIWWIFLACVLSSGDQDKNITAESSWRLISLRLCYLVLCLFLLFNAFLFSKTEKSIRDAVMFFKNREFDKSIAAAQEALVYKSNNDLAYYILARNFRSIEKSKLSARALSYYKKAISLNDNYAFYYGELANYLLMHNKINGARQFSELALKFYPQNKKFQALNYKVDSSKSD